MNVRRTRLLKHAALIAAGVLFGRFVLPRLEPKAETGAILVARNSRCSFALSTAHSFLWWPLSVTDSGDALSCGQRHILSETSFIYCDCFDEPPRPDGGS